MEWDKKIKQAAEALSEALTEAARQCPYEFEIGLQRFGTNGQDLTDVAFQMGPRAELPHADSYKVHIRERGDRKIC